MNWRAFWWNGEEDKSDVLISSDYQVADRLYPETSRQATASTSNGAEGQADEDQDDIEAQIAKELEELQPARDPETGKKKMRFQGARTDTECREL